MTNQTKSLFNRPDTLFGVCEGVGQEFGFNPNWLRVAFAVAMIWNPEIVLTVYALLGVAIYASRLIMPVRSKETVPVQTVETAPIRGENDDVRVSASKVA